MAVETQHYKPWIKHTESMGYNALEIKGLWKMQNAFMGGPFITIIFKTQQTIEFLL